MLQNGRVSSESSDDPERWQSVFAAVTERELRLYESAPWSPEAWSAPVDTCPLLSTRFKCHSILVTMQFSHCCVQLCINLMHVLFLFLCIIFYTVQGLKEGRLASLCWHYIQVHDYEEEYGGGPYKS